MKRTFNRRQFIKLSGFVTLFVGSGFTVGKLFGTKSKSQYSIYGFLPSDVELFTRTINVFYKTVESNSEPIIISDEYHRKILTKLASKANRDFFEENGTVTFSIKKLSKEIKSDIIVSDSNIPIYSINDELDLEIRNIRSELKGVYADVFFSAVYTRTGIFSSLMNPAEKEIIIHTENGLYDRIPYYSSYKSIELKGPQGKTEIEVNKGFVRVVKSTCKHKLCEKVGFAANNNDVIACVPNKILINIEDA